MIRRAVVLGLSLLALFALSAPAAAQTPNNQISYGAVTKAPVGSWAEYLMRKEHEEQTVRVRYTLVQRDPKHIALEIDSATPLGRMLMRLEFSPEGPDRYKLSRARMKHGSEAAKDMPVPEPSPRFGKDDSFGEPVGRGEIVVKAGKFIADHFRRKIDNWTTAVWMDDKVFPVGLVKLEDGQEGVVELVAQGKGGKSAF